MDNITLGQLLKEFRTSRKLLQSDIAHIINKSTSALSRYEKGEAEIPATVLIDFCRYFHISIDKFLGIPFSKSGFDIDEELLNLITNSSDDSLSKIKHYLEITSIVESNNTTMLSDANRKYYIEKSTNKIIPIRGYVAAGTPIEAISNDLGTTESFSCDVDYALIVNGNSMYPLINDGDYVYVKSTKELENGDIGVFYYNGSVTCKKYFKNDSILKLISINPAYEDFTFSLKDQKNEFLDFTIEGKVIIPESH